MELIEEDYQVMLDADEKVMKREPFHSVSQAGSTHGDTSHGSGHGITSSRAFIYNIPGHPTQMNRPQVLSQPTAMNFRTDLHQ